MTRKIKIGVFGAARGSTLINGLFDYPNAQLVAVCDSYTPLLDEVGAKAAEHNLEIMLFDNFEEFIEYDMDAVILANYANEHATYAVKCLEKGKHVLSENIPCETMGQAVELVEAVEKSGLIYAYGENYCYRPDTFEMRQRYQKGDIGLAQYGEGQYIHDCSNVWTYLTYGDRAHWRNREWCTFYCTHSLGPLVFATGLKPKSVVGFEAMPDIDRQAPLGLIRGAGILMVTMENGAVFKSINGWLKREPGNVTWELYGREGSIFTSKCSEMPPFNIYRESPTQFNQGEWDAYAPHTQIAGGITSKGNGYGGCDLVSIHCFVEKILGRPDGDYIIDVYQALDMGIPGLLGYRSILDGNKSYNIPDFRDPEQREFWRNDNYTTNEFVAGPDELLPTSSYGDARYLPQENYDRIKELWEGGHCAQKQ